MYMKFADVKSTKNLNVSQFEPLQSRAKNDSAGTSKGHRGQVVPFVL